MSVPVKPATPEVRRNIFVRDPLRKITHKMKLFNEMTPLGEVPSMWLRWIEPHVQRNWALYRNCWWWDGYVHQESGEPHIFQVVEGEFDDSGKPRAKTRKQLLVKKYITELFINAKEVPSYEVVHLCDNKPCVNPHHFQVRLDHANQRSDEEMARERRDLLSEWEYYKP